jgi:hypothetical protein
MKIIVFCPHIEQKIMVKEYPAFFRALELASPSSFCSANRDRIASFFPCLFVFLLSMWQEEALYFFTCRGERGEGGGLETVPTTGKNVVFFLSLSSHEYSKL